MGTIGRVTELERRVADIDHRFEAIAWCLADALADDRFPDPAARELARTLAQATTAAPGPGDAGGDDAGDAAPIAPPDGLTAWVTWVTTAFDLTERWPPCWSLHEGLRFEMSGLRGWHMALSGTLAGDPSAPLRWSQALHRVADESARRIAQRCLGSHREAVELSQPRTTARVPPADARSR